jgi:hypothetical protein
MSIQFEATNAFCYRFARYQALPKIIAHPIVQSGKQFRLIDLVKEVVDEMLSPEQQFSTYRTAQTGELATVLRTVKWYVPFIAKSTRQLTPLGNGIYKLPSGADIDEAEFNESAIKDSALEDGDPEAAESVGFIYAFTFPALIKSDGAYPIKIGMTTKPVLQRVAEQCKGSAMFDNPQILGQWKVVRVGFVESAIHKVLAARGKWRENVPSTEWFNTTIDEIKLIVEFTNSIRS